LKKQILLFCIAFLFLNSFLFAQGWVEISSLTTKSLSIKLEWQIDKNKYRTNGDGDKFYKTKLRLLYNNGVKENEYNIPDEIYTTGRLDGFGTPCMIMDPAYERITIFILEKDIDPGFYGMTGYAYILNKGKVYFVKETIFTRSNWGWYAFFGGSDNGNPTLCHYSFSGYYAIESKRNSNGTWSNYILGRISANAAGNQWKTHKNILITDQSDVDRMTDITRYTYSNNITGNTGKDNLKTTASEDEKLGLIVGNLCLAGAVIYKESDTLPKSNGSYFSSSSSLFNVIAPELQMGLPLGHNFGVNSARFSPDGKFVVTASDDKTAKIWETVSGKLIHNLEGHAKAVYSAQFSPACPDDPIGGKYIVTASFDNTAKIWETVSGKLIHNLEGHAKAVSSAQFSPDGKYIVTASHDNTAKIWESSSGKLLTTLKGHKGYLCSAQFSPDGKYIVTASCDSTAKIWECSTGKLLHTLVGHTNWIYSAQFSPDGKNIITASIDSTAKIWESSSGKLLTTLKGHKNILMSAQFSPNGKYIVSTSIDNTVKIWENSSGKLIQSFKGYSYLTYFYKFSPDGKYIVTTSYGNKTAKIWETGSGKLLNCLEGHADIIRSAQFSPDGKNIVTASSNGISKIWGSSSGKLLNSPGAHTDYANSPQYSPDGKYIVTIAAPWDSAAKIWESSSGKLLHSLNGHTNQVYSAQFSPACTDDPIGGKYIVTASRDKTAKIWDCSNGKLLNSLEGHTDGVSSAQFSADGKYIVTASQDNTAKIWDCSNGKLLNSLEGHKDILESAQFSADGKYIITASEDNTAKLWESSTGKLLHTLEGHTSIVLSATFSPACPDDPIGGKYIVTISWDNAVKLWESSSGKLLHSLEGHTYWVRYAQFSPDGKYIVTGSWDNTAKIWDIVTGKLIRTIVLKGRFYDINWNTQQIFSHENSQMFLYDLQTGKELLSWIALDSTDWVVTHPSGLFDATPGAMEKMYWVKGLETIDFNQLKDRYWEPGLWEKVMKGEKLRDVQGMNELKLQPEINLAEVKNNKLPVTLIKRDGGYGRIVIMINGKEVEADARGNGFDTTKTTQTILYDIKNNPLLIPGKENTITVKAWSADGFVEGRGVNIIYKPEGDTTKSLPSFYAVVLGVSEYSTNAIHLKYAQPDAFSMANSIKLGAENLFGKDKTFIYTLTSPGETKPTKENIKNVLQEIKTKAKPNDILMLYMSGHGITWGGESGDFYYLTSDAYSAYADAYNDPVIREKNAISTMEFTKWIKEIPALKQLMIIDACGSGKAVDNLLAQRNIDGSQVKAIDRMKDRTGMYIISGCAADAVSYEASRYGQGLLTYTILQAMKGAALREDKYIDVNTLLNYSREEVPKLAAGVGGIQQPQLLIPKGGSFDIGIIQEKDKSKIILSNPKPMFVRSNFIDTDQLEDVLGLSKAMDEALSATAGKGAESSFIFIDTREYPEGCRISGTYTQKGGKINLKYKIKCGEKVEEYNAEGSTAEELVKEVTLKAGIVKN
jgi:WD40 repeat protein